VNEGFKTPIVISVATAILSNVIIGFTLNGAGILPLAPPGAKLPSPLLGPAISKQKRSRRA
jgi:hypothetical protein